MKLLLYEFILSLSVSPLLAEPLHLEGQPLNTSNISLEWSVLSNEIPKRLWVYKVIPQNFSWGIVSNAMAIARFKPKNILNPRDKDMIQLQDSKPYPNRYLKIALADGWMTFYDSKAKMVSSAKAEEVPDDREAEQLARDILLQLGIDRDQVASVRGYAGVERMGRIGSDGSETDAEVVAREISLVRKIDGIPFHGKGHQGGFWIQFADHGKVAGFDLIWRNLQPYELRSLATPEQILALIKKHQAVMPVPFELGQAKKITITSATTYYLGTSWELKQQFVYPIVSLAVTIEGGEKQSHGEILCPLLPDGLAERPDRN